MRFRVYAGTGSAIASSPGSRFSSGALLVTASTYSLAGCTRLANPNELDNLISSLLALCCLLGTLNGPADHHLRDPLSPRRPASSFPQRDGSSSLPCRARAPTTPRSGSSSTVLVLLDTTEYERRAPFVILARSFFASQPRTRLTEYPPPLCPPPDPVPLRGISRGGGIIDVSQPPDKECVHFLSVLGRYIFF